MPCADQDSRLPARRLGQSLRWGPWLLLLAVGCNKNPGGQPWVHKVYIHGNKKVKAGDITGKLAVRASSWFPLTPKRYLEHPFAVDLDRRRIERYYQTRGYFSTKVTGAEVKPYKGPESVDIHYALTEGEPTRIAKVSVRGLESLGEERERIEGRIDLTPGEIFEHERYLVAREALLSRMRGRGYAFAKLKGEAPVDRDTRTVTIYFDAEPGHKVVLGEVLIVGVVQVDAGALRKHANVQTGRVYRPEDLEAVQQKLYNLGLFSTVRVEPVPNPQKPEVADVQITVSEGKFRELRLGIGLGLESQRTEVHGEASLMQRRFLGGLRSLQLTLSAGYAAIPAFWASPIDRHGPLLGFKAELIQPDLLGPNSTLTWTLAYDVGIEYAYQYHGPGTRLGAVRGLWRDRIKLALAYNFQYLDFFNTEAAILSNPAQAGALYGYLDPYRLGYLQETATLDLRRRDRETREYERGIYLGLMFEHGGVYTGSAFDYQKLLPEVRAYFTFGKRLTVAARVQYGRMFVQGETGSPITQRFYLGGPNSHRGFNYNRLSYQVCSATEVPPPMNTPFPVPTLLPRTGPSTCARGSEDGNLINFRRLPIGGDEMILGQLELRLKLFRLFERWLTLAAFTDVGDVAAPAQGACTADTCDPVPYLDRLDFTKMHVAVGGGLRYNTIIGTIRFDLGVRLNRVEPDTDGYQNPDPGGRVTYHISIGESF